MNKKYIVMKDSTVNIPNYDSIIVNDKNELLTPLKLDKIDNFILETPKDDTIKNTIIYIIPASLGLLKESDYTNQYIWKFTVSNGLLEKNTVYNRFILDKLPEKEQLAFYIVGKEDLHTDIKFKILSNDFFHCFKITPDVENLKVIFPLKTSYLFKDPLYSSVLSRYYDNDLVGLKQGIADITSAILRDSSINNNKLADMSVTSRNLKPNTIMSTHFNVDSMKSFSVNNFKQDYDAAKLVYDNSGGNVTRFDTTTKTKWSIGGEDGVTNEISLISSTFEDFRITYTGTTLVRTSIDSYPRYCTMNSTLFSNNNNEKQNIKLITAKLSSDSVETKGLILSNYPYTSNSDTTVDKTSAILTLTRDAGSVQVALNGFTNGSTPSSASFVTGVLGGRSGNDYVDLVQCITEGVEPEHGYCYAIDLYTNKIYKTKDSNDINNFGVCSRKYAVYAGDKEIEHFPLAVAGIVECYYDGKCTQDNLGLKVVYSKNGTVALHNNDDFFPAIGQIRKIVKEYDKDNNQKIIVRLF